MDLFLWLFLNSTFNYDNNNDFIILSITSSSGESLLLIEDT